MGQFNHYSSQEWVCSCPLHHDTSKELFAIIVVIIKILVLPRGRALGAWCNAAFQCQSSPLLPSSTSPPEPCGTPGAEQSQDWDLCFQQSRTHQRCHHQPRGLSRAQHGSCSCLREAALGPPSTSLLRAPHWGWGSSCRVKLHFTFQMLRFKDWSFHGPWAWPNCWWTWFGWISLPVSLPPLNLSQNIKVKTALERMVQCKEAYVQVECNKSQWGDTLSKEKKEKKFKSWMCWDTLSKCRSLVLSTQVKQSAL